MVRKQQDSDLSGSRSRALAWGTEVVTQMPIGTRMVIQTGGILGPNVSPFASPAPLPDAFL